MGVATGSGPPAGVRPGRGLVVAALAAVALLLVSLAPLGQAPAMRASDLVSALIAIVSCGWWWNGSVAARWLVATLGGWLLLAPLVLWAPQMWSCLVDLAAGCLLILGAAILPTASACGPGGEVPLGWDYNPSAWNQRIPIALLALLGFAMAGWLAAYQLGYVTEAWDPLFGDGTRRVLTSDISHWFPVSDAGLGAVSYLLEAITCFIGDRRRWRTMPWMVLLFGLMVVPTGAVSIVLVVLQPIGVGSWCTLCLMTAVVMLLMVAPAVDEVVATWQLLQRSRRQGRSWWTVLWRGTDEPPRQPLPPAPQSQEAWPWHLLAVSAAGAWLMAAPYLTGTAGTVAGASHHLTGALVVTVAVIALGEITRPVRWLLVPLALWLSVGAWWLPGATIASTGNGVMVAALLLVAAPVRGRVRSRFAADTTP